MVRSDSWRSTSSRSARSQRRDVERPAQALARAGRCRPVRRRLELVEEPQPLLRVGRRQDEGLASLSCCRLGLHDALRSQPPARAGRRAPDAHERGCLHRGCRLLRLRRPRRDSSRTVGSVEDRAQRQRRRRTRRARATSPASRAASGRRARRSCRSTPTSSTESTPRQIVDDPALGVGARRDELVGGGGAVPLRCGQRVAVDLAVRRERQLRQRITNAVGTM